MPAPALPQPGDGFLRGAGATVAELSGVDPHSLLADLRRHEPVSWLPALGGWLVTRYDLALEAMRDADRFTVQDERFSTAQVIGPSMLSLDGPVHERHRAPFVSPFRAAAVRERFTAGVTSEAEALVDALEHSLQTGDGAAELRGGFSAPLAAATVSRALGLAHDEVPAVLAAYAEIVRAVTEITSGVSDGTRGREAFNSLARRLRRVIDGSGAAPGTSLLAAAAASGALTPEEVVSNAAVLLFGGIETTDGMIANALVHLLERPELIIEARAHPELLHGVTEESLRLEPAAAVIDRYATRDTELGGAQIAAGELVRISIAAANRDPAVFVDPNRLDPERGGARRHLAFAQGAHVCVGVHLARLEARHGLVVLLERLPTLRPDETRPPHITGLVFRKPAELWVRTGEVG